MLLKKKNMFERLIDNSNFGIEIRQNKGTAPTTHPKALLERRREHLAGS